ncbi:hypothetical protein ACXX4F_15365 [Bacillus cereus]
MKKSPSYWRTKGSWQGGEYIHGCYHRYCGLFLTHGRYGND